MLIVCDLVRDTPDDPAGFCLKGNRNRTDFEESGDVDPRKPKLLLDVSGEDG